MLTFPEEDTLPLAGSIITDHFGIDYAEGPDHSVCSRCGASIPTNEIAEQHAGDCPND